MKVTIYTRQKDENGWRYQRVNTGRGRRPDRLRGPFFLRYTDENGKQPWVPAGDTLNGATEAAGQLQTALLAKSKGLTVSEFERLGNGNRLSAKAATFLAETKANKANKTYLAYRNSLTYLQEVCRKNNLEEITREDMLAFKTHLRDERLSERSIYNNFLNAMVFLKWCGVKPGVKSGDWPPKLEREPEEYSEEEIITLLGAAKADERLALNSFLCSGLRSGELAHLTYGDIDYKHSVWTVQPKKEWKTKTLGSQRDVPVPEWLTKKIRQRQEAGKHHNADLIFPNTEGNPNLHLERIVKRVAKRAKMTGRVDDHKFRATAITRWLRDGNSPQDVMAWVGHTSLETILRYAAKVNVRKPETRKKATKSFEAFETVGD